MDDELFVLNIRVEPDLEVLGTEEMLSIMLQEGDQTELTGEQPSVSALLAPLTPITALDHPPGRAVRQASFAPKASWQEGHPGHLYYIADNGLEVSLGTPEQPLDLTEARQQIKKLGESTVLTDRLLFWFWNIRRRPRPEDGKVFVGKNGSVPVTLVEILQMLGATKHTKLEHPGQRYTDGYRTEHRRRVERDVALLSSLYVQGTYTVTTGGSSVPTEVKGAYIRFSRVFVKETLVGFFVQPGDWINTIDLPDIPSLIRIDEQIFQFNTQNDQHEIRLSLYLSELFRDQAVAGTLGKPLQVPVENQPGRFRLPTMEDLLGGALIAIDYNNLTTRFVPRVEHALEILQAKEIIGQWKTITPVDKSQGQWGKTWLHTQLIIQAPEGLIREYQALRATYPALHSRQKRKKLR